MVRASLSASRANEVDTDDQADEPGRNLSIPDFNIVRKTDRLQASPVRSGSANIEKPNASHNQNTPFNTAEKPTSDFKILVPSLADNGGRPLPGSVAEFREQVPQVPRDVCTFRGHHTGNP